GGIHLQLSGTSMAAPHVTGTVALCISRGMCTGGESPASVVSMIQTTAGFEGFTGDPGSPISGRYYGYIDWASASPPVPPSPPSAPAVIGRAGNGLVRLSWSAPSDGGSPITGYKVYRGTTSGGESLLASLGNVLSYVDTNVTNGTTYYFTVSAVNAH